MQPHNLTPEAFISAALNILMVEDDLTMQSRLRNILVPSKLLGAKTPVTTSSSTELTTDFTALTQPDLNGTATTHAVNLVVAQSSQETLNLMAQDRPVFQLALLDLGLPDGHGLDLIPILRDKYPDIIILVITVCATDNILLSCIQAGANGYLLKEREDFELAIAIKHVLNGAMPIDPFMAKALIALSTQKIELSPSAHFELSNREMEILKLVTNGLSNRDIAEQLHLSRFTIDTHIRNIYAKLAVNNRSKAIAAVNKFKLF